MKREIIKLYKQYRQAGYHSNQALRNAKIQDKFEALQYVYPQLEIIADMEQENYFDVYGEPDTEEEKKEIIRQIELYNITYVAVRFGDHTIDGIGMCIYPDPTNPLENTYVPDLMAAAIDYLSNREN